MEKSIEYSIRRVVVFPDRARVICCGKVDVNLDVSTLLFDELPLNVDPDSLQVGGKGAARVRILGVDITRQHYEYSPSEHVLELENQLDRLKDELYSLKDQYTVLDAQLEHLQGLRLATGKYARSLSRGRSSVDDHTQLISFFREQDERMRSERREININSRVLDRQISKLERELNDLRSVQPLCRFQARVTIEVLESGEFWPELAYIVSQAGWRPLYDIRLVEHEIGKSLEMSSIAQISQKTGQDWNGVQLSVSTARPALNQRLPELTTWYIDEMLPPQPRMAKTRTASFEPAMAVMSDAAPDAVEFEMEGRDFVRADAAHASIQDSGSAVRFEVAGNWDIPSDGSSHKMVLTSFEQDPKINYLAIPKHTDAVYRRAAFDNNSGSALLDGVASIFVNDEFIGKTQIKYTPSEGELELLLGVEEQIIIKRELTKQAVDKRLLREKRALQYAYKIELTNLLPTNANVEVQDQIPVSKHEQIKIKLELSRPEPNKKSDLNLLEWHLDIAPAAKVSIEYEFVVEHPSTMRISGLKE